MQEQFQKMIGQVVALHTNKGVEIGIVQAVNKEGVELTPIPKKDRKALNPELVFGGGFYRYGGFGAYRGFGYPGYGFGYPGFGFGGGIGVGVGVGAGFGFGYPGFLW